MWLFTSTHQLIDRDRSDAEKLYIHRCLKLQHEQKEEGKEVENFVRLDALIEKHGRPDVSAFEKQGTNTLSDKLMCK